MCDYDDIELFECPLRTLWTFYQDTGDPFSVSFSIQGYAEWGKDRGIFYISKYELWATHDFSDFEYPTLLYLEFQPTNDGRVKVFEGDSKYTTQFKEYISITETEEYTKKRVREIVEKIKSLSFKEFKRWVKENFYDFKKAWFYQTKEEARQAGRGVIDMAKMVASEDILPDGWDYMDVVERILF